EAAKIGYLPLEGEAVIALAPATAECMDNDEALRSAKRAALIGVATHQPDMAAEGATLLGQLLADRTSELARAQAWLGTAEALMQGESHPDPVLEAWRLQGLARVYQKSGDPGRTFDALHRARALLEAAYGPDHPDIARVLINTGLNLAEGGRFEEA